MTERKRLLSWSTGKRLSIHAAEFNNWNVASYAISILLMSVRRNIFPLTPRATRQPIARPMLWFVATATAWSFANKLVIAFPRVAHPSLCIVTFQCTRRKMGVYRHGILNFFELWWDDILKGGGKKSEGERVKGGQAKRTKSQNVLLTSCLRLCCHCQ